MNKIAALYDIHGNLPALNAVLADIETLNVDAIVVGGDVIAGPLPLQTLNRLSETSKTVPTYFIHGNHESEMLMAASGAPIAALSERAVAEAKWLSGYLPAATQATIATWPMTQTLSATGLGEVLFCHATPSSDTIIFTAETAVQRLLPIFANVQAQTVICGHTHMQFDRQIGHVRVLNAGSVGLPIGQTGADWLLIDGGEVEFRHTDYDLETAAFQIMQSDYPQAESFVESSIRQPTSKATALEIMGQLAAKQNLNG